MLILVKGAGDLATGTAVRLHRAGFQVVMTEVAQPTAVRRTVAFSQCMYDGQTTVEGITARRAADRTQVKAILAAGETSTGQILDYIRYAKEKGCSMTGPEDPDILRLNVLKGGA